MNFLAVYVSLIWKNSLRQNMSDPRLIRNLWYTYNMRLVVPCLILIHQNFLQDSQSYLRNLPKFQAFQYTYFGRSKACLENKIAHLWLNFHVFAVLRFRSWFSQKLWLLLIVSLTFLMRGLRLWEMDSWNMTLAYTYFMPTQRHMKVCFGFPCNIFWFFKFH